MIILFFISISLLFMTKRLYSLGFKNTVLISSVMTLIVFTILWVIRLRADFNFDLYSTFIYGISFMSMTTEDKISPQFVILASFVYVVLFSTLTPNLPSIGGALGTTAFISVTLTIFLLKILKRLRFF